MEVSQPTGIELIVAERNEQIEKHGHTIAKDIARHSQLVPPFNMLPLRLVAGKLLGIIGGVPYPKDWGKDLTERLESKTAKERLVIAGALIAAEIDRLNAIGE